MSNEQSEQEFLSRYQRQEFSLPAVTVDLVIFTVLDTDLKILLVRRGEHPFKNHFALPGGFVRVQDDGGGEDLEDAAYRELFEETALPRSAVYLEQLRAFGKANRDPRMRVVTVAYFSLIRPDLAPLIVAGGDAINVHWASVHESLQHQQQPKNSLAFDHDEIVAFAVQRLREKIDRLAFRLVPKTFSVTELRAVYEAVNGKAYDASNFRRGFRRLLQDGCIEQAPGKRSTMTRPAKVYRFID